MENIVRRRPTADPAYPDSRVMRCAFTGHRPLKMPFGYNEEDPRCIDFKRRLHDTIEMLIWQGYTHFLSGGAMGMDMYAGEIVEYGTLVDIFTGDKHHPYTDGLFGAIPSLTGNSRRLNPIDGLMPDPTNLPEGCNFAPRCKHCMEICKKQNPGVYEENGHQIRCHLFTGQEKNASEVQK